MGARRVQAIWTFTSVLNWAAKAATESVSRLPGQDVTEEFLHRNTYLPELTRHELALLKKTHVIFIPGMMAEFINAFVGKYFENQIRWCRQNGVSFEVLNSKSQLPTFARGFQLSKMMENHENVVIISHSKGGLDLLRALVEFPRLRSKVVGWVSLQTPFLGAPLADLACSGVLSSAIAKSILKLCGGGRFALKELRSSERREFLKQNHLDITEIVRRIPLVCVATSKEDKDVAGHDGLLPHSSAVLPGSEYVLLENVDHASTVIDGLNRRLNPTLFIQTLLSMLLRRAEQRGML